MPDFESYLKDKRDLINAELDRQLPPSTTPPTILHQAMRYSVLSAGKRLRPIVCLAATAAVGGREENALLPAIALEILHTYTLVHDDLPALDNDRLRRGKPTVHVQFGEANALLAGDALLTLAFEWISRTTPLPPYHTSDYSKELAQAAGSQGIVAGQVEDMAAEGKPPQEEELLRIHRYKTAVLWQAAARFGAMAGGAQARTYNHLSHYGIHLGMAFQIMNDVRGREQDTPRGKMTAITVWGKDAAQRRALEHIKKAQHSLTRLVGVSHPLMMLAASITEL